MSLLTYSPSVRPRPTPPSSTNQTTGYPSRRSTTVQERVFCPFFRDHVRGAPTKSIVLRRGHEVFQDRQWWGLKGGSSSTDWVWTGNHSLWTSVPV